MGIWNSFKSKVKAALASLGMLTGVDVTHLMQNFKMDERLANEIMKSIYVGRGKGGKKQAHRPTGAAAITIKVCVKGLPDNHQFALDEFKESFYNPNKQMLESNFAVSTSIVHDRSFILYKNMRGESCKHIG